MMHVTRRSPITGQWHTMELPLTNAELLRWGEGEALAEALPAQLSEAQRLFLATGIPADEWQRYVVGPDPVGGEG
jgi:hypothetical protein